MAEVFDPENSQNYFKWLKDNPKGFVWNVAKQRLHSADCRFVNYKYGSSAKKSEELPRRKRISRKICSTSKYELIGKDPRAGDSKHYCSVCSP